MLRLVQVCPGHRFHVKVPPQKLSVQHGEPISPHWNDLRQALYSATPSDPQSVPGVGTSHTSNRSVLDTLHIRTKREKWRWTEESTSMYHSVSIYFSITGISASIDRHLTYLSIISSIDKAIIPFFHPDFIYMVLCLVE